MAHKKVGWLKDATMKSEGIFADNGEKLVSGNFDKKAQDAFNGKPKKKKTTKKAKVEEKETGIVEKIKKKFKK